VGQSHPVTLVAGTRATALYGATEAVEEYWCNYGVNPHYAKPLADVGLVVSGRGPEGEIRIVELANHPFFVATLFLPQKRSAPGQPHPVLRGFAAAVGGPATGRTISGKMHAH
jgi:CTP synthase (UTP-ammonia lyase)